MKKSLDLKSPIVRAVLFLLLLIATDFCAGKILRHFYRSQKTGRDFSTMYAAETTTADILIFGASRAQQQYIPTFIEDTLQVSCYNVGRDGLSFPYHYAILQSVLKRYSPKAIILDCEYGMLKDAASSYERLSCLLPLYSDHPEIRNIVELRSPYEKFKLLSSVYPFNSSIFKIISGNMPDDKPDDIKGYLRLDHSLNHPIKTYDLTNEYPLDSIKISMLKSFINDCKQRNIQLYFFCGPYYMKTIGNDYSQTVAKEIADKNKVDFIDYSNLESFQSNPQLFDDTVHLNYEGAKIFSAMVASELNKRIANK